MGCNGRRVDVKCSPRNNCHDNFNFNEHFKHWYSRSMVENVGVFLWGPSSYCLG